MTKTEFQTACKLLNGFEIEEGKYYKLDNGDIIVVRKLFKNKLRYETWMGHHDLIIKYYHELVGQIKERTDVVNKKFITSLNDMIPKYYEDFTKKYNN